MRTKLLRQLRKEARNHVTVYKKSGMYEVRQLNDFYDFNGYYKVLDTFSDKDEAVKSCDHYRRSYIYYKIREMYFGKEETKNGRVY